MGKKPEFHGSDLEKIEEYYHIPKEEIVCFSANVNPLGLSETVRQKLCDHLDVICRYPDRAYTSLRQTIGAYCGADPAHIVVGNGSTELISLLISQRGPKKALVLGPTYSEYARELSLAGGSMEYYHLREADDFVLDIDDFLSHVTGEVDMVILCNPNNPTSSAIPREDMERIIAQCRKQGVFVMIDETYVEFAPDVQAVSAISLVPAYDNFMVIRGVSKFFAAPGLRFGYGITSNQTFLSALLTHQNPWSLNSIGAFAGEEMLKDTDYIANGDIACLESISKYEERYGLHFAKARLSFPDYDGQEITANVILDTLTSESPALSAEQQNMLYAGVNEDYSHITSKKKRYEAVREDKYFNALQLKYANAVTCHKSQGGQWKCVFIDNPFWQEELLPDDLKWLYTAITRSTEKVYLVNFKDEFFI